MLLLDVINFPAKAIASSRKKGEKHVVRLLLLNSLLAALAGGLLLLRLSLVSSLYLGAAVAMASTAFLVVFFASLFFAYVLHVIVNTLGGSGRYNDALTCIVYASSAPALGFLVSSLLMFVPLLGIMSSLLVMALTAALGMATLYRAVRELFRTDMLVSFVSLNILIISLAFSVYGMAALRMSLR